MRNPDRLDKFYDELKRIHKEYFPDWRFGQMIENVKNLTKVKDLFYYEEDEFLKLIKNLVGEEE